MTDARLDTFYVFRYPAPAFRPPTNTEVPLTKEERRERSRRLKTVMVTKNIHIHKVATALGVGYGEVAVLLRGENKKPRDYNRAIEFVESY